MKDPVVSFLEGKIAQIEASRYGEEKRATPGLLAWLHRQIEERKAKVDLRDSELARALQELIAAARPFLLDTVVTQTSGTIPRIDRLEEAIEEAQDYLAKANQ